jgi:hypothetical protein
MASNDQAGTRAGGTRARAAEVLETARARAGAVTRQATEQMSVYPVAAVVGGFALGALVAAVLPRTEREEKLLGKAGRRIADAAREAAHKGLDAGKTQFEEIRAKAAQKVGEAVGEAVSGAVSGKS